MTKRPTKDQITEAIHRAADAAKARTRYPDRIAEFPRGVDDVEDPKDGWFHIGLAGLWWSESRTSGKCFMIRRRMRGSCGRLSPAELAGGKAVNDALWGFTGVLVGATISTIGTIWIAHLETRRAKTQQQRDDLYRLQDALLPFGDVALQLNRISGHVNESMVIDIQNRIFNARIFANRIRDPNIRSMLEKYISILMEVMSSTEDLPKFSANFEDWSDRVAVNRKMLDDYIGLLLRGESKGRVARIIERLNPVSLVKRT